MSARVGDEWFEYGIYIEAPDLAVPAEVKFKIADVMEVLGGTLAEERKYGSRTSDDGGRAWSADWDLPSKAAAELAEKRLADMLPAGYAVRLVEWNVEAPLDDEDEEDDEDEV